MRPLHLLGLMPPDYRFYAPDGSPLVLPGAIPRGDQEILLAYYQQVVTERIVPRVEVDWYTMLLEPSRHYLERIFEQRGSSGTFLVVKVRQQGVDLREIMVHPVIRAFEYVAISNVHPGGGEELRTLLAVAYDAMNRARDLYDEMTDRLGLREDGWQLIVDFVRTLQNPIDILETVNALIEIQLEKVPPEDQRKRILHRMLIRLLEWRPAGELCALTWIATKGYDVAQTKLAKEATVLLAGLEAQDLLQEKKLQQWAKYLEHRVLWEGIFATEGRLPTAAQLTEGWAKRVRAAIRVTGRRSPFNVSEHKAEIKLAKELASTFQDAVEGKLARARERIQAVEREMNRGFFSAGLHGFYWYTLGRIEMSEGANEQAEGSLRTAMQFAGRSAERGTMAARGRGRMAYALGDILFVNKKYEEAELVLRDALQLRLEGGETKEGLQRTKLRLNEVLLALGKPPEF